MRRPRAAPWTEVPARNPALDARFSSLAAYAEKCRKAGIVLYRQQKLQDYIQSKIMKKTIIAFAITMLGFAGSSYAATPKSTDPVPANVESEFSQQFTTAMDVRWEEGKNFFKATFEDWGRTLFAFYADNGDLMGVATNLSTTTLPERLREQVRKSYTGYWITDLFGYHNADEKGFVITLENADKVVVLKAVGNESWSVYKTTTR
jgi:hypothetical protein